MNEVTHKALTELSERMRTEARTPEHWSQELDAIIAADGLADAVEAERSPATDPPSND